MSSALVVYESMYGNTREIAEAIVAGLREGMDAKAVPVHLADAADVDDADLLVVGGPTHVHGMASATSRKGAIQAAKEDGIELDASAHAEPTLRAWLAERGGDGRQAAAFDTRIDRSPLLTGSAARGIAKRLRRRGYVLATDSNSFFVDDSEGPLADGEVERARKWGAGLARLAAREAAASTTA
jgi:hypothetical protein